MTRLKLAAQRRRRPANAEKSVSWPRKKKSSRTCRKRKKLQKSESKFKVITGFCHLLINLDKRGGLIRDSDCLMLIVCIWFKTNTMQVYTHSMLSVEFSKAELCMIWKNNHLPCCVVLYVMLSAVQLVAVWYQSHEFRYLN